MALCIFVLPWDMLYGTYHCRRSKDMPEAQVYYSEWLM